MAANVALLQHSRAHRTRIVLTYIFVSEEKKSRVQFLKTEMKLIELDAKIKTCLCLEKADTDMCLKLLDELIGKHCHLWMTCKYLV